MSKINSLSILSNVYKRHLKIYKKDRRKYYLTYNYESVDSCINEFIIPLIEEINILIVNKVLVFDKEKKKLKCINKNIFVECGGLVPKYYRDHTLKTYSNLYKLLYDPADFRSKYFVLINNNEELNKFGLPDYGDFEMSALNMFLTLVLRNILAYYLYSDFKKRPFEHFPVNNKKLTKRGLIRIIKDLAQPDSIWWLYTDKAKKIADYLITKIELINF